MSNSFNVEMSGKPDPDESNRYAQLIEYLLIKEKIDHISVLSGYQKVLSQNQVLLMND